jgi:hypothetical protein
MEIKIGDVCRAKCTAPARYVGDGQCLFVSAQDNSLNLDDARPAKGGEENLPLPSDRELEAFRVGIKFKAGLHRLMNQQR